MDYVGHALAADRADGEVDVFEPEAVRGDLLQREALGGDLLQRKLASLEAMAACAVHGDELHRKLLQREIRKFRQFPLHHNGAALALERLDAEQDRDRSGAGRAVERDVDTFAAGDLPDAR